jgi:hypothetical protein
MSKTTTSDHDILKYARIGARTQVERAFAAFPELRAEMIREVKEPRSSGPTFDLPVGVQKAERSAAKQRGRMTDAGRKRISDMMKKRWRAAKKARRNHL